MKNYFLFAAALFMTVAMTSCHEDVEQPPLPELSVSESAFDFQSIGGSGTFTVQANRPFSIISDATWLAFDPQHVDQTVGETGEHTITVTALPNTRYEDRTGTVTVKISSDHKDLTIAQAGDPNSTPALIYFNDFDRGISTENEDIVSGGSDIWQNATGYGVTQSLKYYASLDPSTQNPNVSARDSRPSDGNNYADYTGSGDNNIFFGKQPTYFVISGLRLHQNHKDFVMTFGVDPGQDGTYRDSDFPVMISRDGSSWVTLPSCEFSDVTGDAPVGLWAFASVYFSLPESETVSSLWIRFAPGVDSSYRIDDLTLRMAEEYEMDRLTEIDWSDSQNITISGTPIDVVLK